MILGAHLSIAGGLHKALLRAADLGCNALQIFTHSPVQWRVKPLIPEEIARFRETRASLGSIAVASHAGYLINLASPERALRERSIRMMIRELERCEALGVALLVSHPGAHMGGGEARGLRRVASSLRKIHASTAGFEVKTVVENTAGQGSNLGWRFEQIAHIIDLAGDASRLRVCFDTAHAFAAGYDLRNRGLYEEMWRQVEGLIGLKNIAIFHLNDATAVCGSLVDRHAHIGQGQIGQRPFGWILRDGRFARVMKVIETPKQAGMDRKNLALLRRLTRSPAIRGA